MIGKLNRGGRNGQLDRGRMRNGMLKGKQEVIYQNVVDLRKYTHTHIMPRGSKKKSCIE